MKETTDWLELDFYDSEAFFSPNRRDFLKTLGGGIIILFFAGEEADAQRSRTRRDLPDDVNAFLKIGEDGRVTCTTGKIEMGQGIITALAQIVADELDAAMESVNVVLGDTAICPYDGGTHGSRTIRFFAPPLRAAAAEARGVLLELAAERLNAPLSRLSVKDGTVFDTSDKQKRVTYAQLTQGQQIVRRLKEKAVQKTSKDYNVIGKPYYKVDSAGKVTGQAKFASDITVPDMWYARILRPPAHDAKFISADTSAAESMDEVLVVRDGDFIAVLAKNPDRAGEALYQIKAKYETPAPTVDDVSIFDHLMGKVSGEGNTTAEDGDLKTGESVSAIVEERTYLNSYVAHAPIEPHAVTIEKEGDKVTIWASTQDPFPMQESTARVLGYPLDNVRVITPFVGSGFGGKRTRLADEAARVVKLSGKSIQITGTREEEFFHDNFRPAAIVKIKAGVTDAGRLSFWNYGVYYAGQRGALQFYDIPHHKTVVFGSGFGGGSGIHPFGTGAWRAPANNTNTFARESHIDILAAKAGIDPLEFRLKNLKDERMIRTLEAAAEKFGWTPAKAPSQRGYGIALGIDSGTYVAHIAEVKVDGRGHVEVKRVVCAQDMGLCINPQGAKIQMEGCVMMGLGYSLTEEIHFKGGTIEDLNFSSYDIPRFSWLPEIETVIIDAKDDPAQGGGEPAIICTGAAIANAVFDATGARVLQLPMTPERIVKAL